MSCVTDAAGASLVLVVAGVSVSAPPQKAGLNASPAKLTISAPANVVAVLQRPMISSIAWSRYAGWVPAAPGGFARRKTARGLAVCQSHLPTGGRAETKFATLNSVCCCLALGQACKFGRLPRFPWPEFCDARADFIQDAIPT